MQGTRFENQFSHKINDFSLLKDWGGDLNALSIGPDILITN